MGKMNMQAEIGQETPVLKMQVHREDNIKMDFKETACKLS